MKKKRKTILINPSVILLLYCYQLPDVWTHWYLHVINTMAYKYTVFTLTVLRTL